MKLNGSCLCGGVRYAVLGPFQHFVHCHCTECRKVHGTVYGSSAVVSSSDVEFETGASLKAYVSSPGKKRWFCANCGSHIYSQYDERTDQMVLRVGTLDSTGGQRPVAHIWVSDKADWYEIRDDLRRFDTELMD